MNAPTQTPARSTACPARGSFTVKQDRVADELRRQILAGELAPATKLPRQSDLKRQFDVSQTTITKAVDLLKRQGFIEAKRRAGTRVARTVPHLTNVAIAVPTERRFSARWSKYYAAAADAAAELERQLGRSLRVVEGTDDPRSEGHSLLTELVRTHQIAGVIFLTRPFNIAHTEILTTPDVPRVAVMAPPPAPGIDSVVSLGGDLMEKALDHLAARGRKRVAVVTVPSGTHVDQSPCRDLLKARGMLCPPHWQIEIPFEAPQCITNVVRLLMHASQKERPDALLILNDNLLDDALAGLAAEGVKVPDDLEVVSHGNFPCVPLKFMPVKRIGPDLTRMLRDCIAVIDRLRAGRKAPKVMHMPAVWENEAERIPPPRPDPAQRAPQAGPG